MEPNRRQFLASSAVLTLGNVVWPRPSWAQPGGASTSFEELRRHVGIFTGRGGTIGWYVTPDALVVVDSQFPETAAICLEGLHQKSNRQVDALINTHHHGDHTGGNSVFKPAVKTIVAHTRVPELLEQQAAGASQGPAPALPDTTFDEVWTLDLGAETVSARHHGPGHTGGDAVITFANANVVHMGDLMFHGRHPFIDRPAGASIQGWIDQLVQTVEDHDDDTVYIFGHAREGLPVTGPKADVLAFRDYLSTVLEHVQTGIQAGQSREEVVLLHALPGFEDYAEMAPRLTLETVLGVAYDELTNGA